MKITDTERKKIKAVLQKLNYRLDGLKQHRNDGQRLTWAEEMIEDNVKAQINILQDYKCRHNI